ncbi:MAG: HNH endonuclease signature motif containing protein [Lamprobacter sp.]|uniref:HNH endonuclease n=1 Tax=Lamprobacter sp. TaxID=3100796 RepID=UPI002B25ABFE|nr:HNH endonuclease signature motif containing protein [Lamprobacter sp.]MEA3643651.1 HNH endonuclease signature motif containing protein [Lamprobacter sp.]
MSKEQEKYAQVNYIIRAKLYKGLMDDKMCIGSIFQDEKIKINQGNICSYCGSAGPLALDHVIPRFIGGEDKGDNLIYACRSCNSSKGKKDLMEWMHQNNRFPPLMVLRRFLKLAIDWSVENDAMNLSIEAARQAQLPFNVEFVPIQFPTPDALCLIAKAQA